MGCRCGECSFDTYESSSERGTPQCGEDAVRFKVRANGARPLQEKVVYE